MGLIILKFSQIIKAVDPYREREKIKLQKKKQKSVKKIIFREKLRKKLSDLFVEILIVFRKAAIRISNFLIDFF